MAHASINRLINGCFLILMVGACSGCGGAEDLPGDAGSAVRFNDLAPANASVSPEDLLKLTLQDPEGHSKAIGELRAGKPLVLIVTRGLVGSEKVDDKGNYGKSYCTYCSTQVSRLIANYDSFRKRDAEVIVVFPIARAKDEGEVQKFAARVQGPRKTTRDSPFPILLDIDLHAVDALGIRADLSKPATYIIDTEGEVRYAYVGKNVSDRPSVQALLDQLDALAKKS
jgi:peroxiredoxin